MRKSQAVNVLGTECRNPWDKKELGMFQAVKANYLNQND